jgi:hypothetical protein
MINVHHGIAITNSDEEGKDIKACIIDTENNEVGVVHFSEDEMLENERALPEDLDAKTELLEKYYKVVPGTVGTLVSLMSNKLASTDTVAVFMHLLTTGVIEEWKGMVDMDPMMFDLMCASVLLMPVAEVFEHPLIKAIGGMR